MNVNASGASPAATGYEPILRSVGRGETRVLGTFTTVECAPKTVVLRIDAAEGTVRLAAASLTDVEFLSYRPDSPTSIACGAQNPALRVLATYRSEPAAIAGTETTRRAVAIELLPEGFTPTP